MVVTDPIADMLTRIRNAQVAKHDAVTYPPATPRRRSPRSCLMKAISKVYRKDR